MAVTCPECEKTLQVRADLPAGKRIRCPNCDTVFAPSAEADDEVIEGYSEKPQRKPARSRRDDDDDYEDDVDRERRPRKKKSKSRRGSSAVLVWSLVGGAVGLIVIGAVIVILLIGGARSTVFDQHDALAKETVQLLSDLENVMKSVKDQESARAAAGRLNQICDRMEALGRKVQALPKITVAEDNRLKEKYKAQIDAINQRMNQVGFQAGVNSRGEPSFMAAAKRLVSVGQSLQRLGM